MAAMGPEGELHRARTLDGWSLALLRRRPERPRRQTPVVLCHGLAASALVFDPAPDVSLARRLEAEGFDVWMLDLRGHGRSERPGDGSGRRFGWSFDDYLTQDVPAAVAYVKRATGTAAVQWVGHSMGGILLYAHLALGARDIRAAATIGSSLDYSVGPSDFHSLRRLLFLTRVLPCLPVGLLGRGLAPFAGRVANPVERFLYCPGAVDPPLLRRMLRHAFHAVSSPVLAQLASAFEPGGLRAWHGSFRYRTGLGQATTPVLALAGDRDRQCPPAASQATLELLGTDARRLAVFGPERGHRSHYGHFDLLWGRHAPAETHPEIVSWLAAHDGERTPAAAPAMAATTTA